MIEYLCRRRADAVAALLLIVSATTLAAPTILRMRGQVGQEECKNRLKQIGLAVHNFESAYGSLPPVARGPKPGPEGSAFFHLLPYMEQDNLFRRAAGSVRNNDVWGTPMKQFVCPSDASHLGQDRFGGWLATGSYATNFLVLGDSKTGDFDAKNSLSKIRDGTSNTILIGERYRVCGETPNGWGYPDPTPWCPTFAVSSLATFQDRPRGEQCDPLRAQSSHLGRMMIGLADGSVRSLSSRVNPVAWHYLCDPADGQVLTGDHWAE